MKAQRVSLWLLATALCLCAEHARGLRRCLTPVDMRQVEESFQSIRRAVQAKDTFQNVTILSTPEILHRIKPLDVCCVTKSLLAFYVDRVFKDHQERNPHVLRKISSIANSFLFLQRALQRCQEQRLCPCGPEATNATGIVHDNYSQLEVRSAALKALGELDVLLAWIGRNHQGAPAARGQRV